MVKKKLDFDLKEGAFTRMSKEKGYGNNVQKFANDIMKHREKGKLPNGKRITPLMVKRANFVVVSRKFKKK
jgi:hypothetical protein